MLSRDGVCTVAVEYNALSLLLSQLDQQVVPVPGPGLLFGLMLAAAITGGYLAHALRVPRVVGYLVAGAALKLLVCWLLKAEPQSDAASRLHEAVEPLSAIKDLGLGVILFSIGAVFEVRHLKNVGGRIVKIAFCESGLTFLLVSAGTIAASMFVAGGEVPSAIVLSFGILLGFASIATAPAATLFVLREYDAKGPVTDTILSLTGVNNVICIIAFHLCFSLLAAMGVLGEPADTQGTVWIELAALTLGSLVLGAALGFLLSILHAKLQLSETLLILTATLIILGAGEKWLLEHHDLSYNFLLTALFAGAVFSNIAIDPKRLEESLQSMSRPILVGFFVIAGYQLHLTELADFRVIGVAYVVCRLAGKILGARAGVLWTGSSGELKPFLGSALLCQAAVVIGLADYVTEYWQHAWADRFETVVLGSVVFFETCGPLLTKSVVKRAGEVKAVTLLRRSGPVSSGGASSLALICDSFLRMIGLRRAVRTGDGGGLQVRHIMRTSIKPIPADSDFHAVLRLVEQSRFNHFPVVDENEELVGVLHFSDIREIIYDPYLSRLMTALDLANPDTRAVHAKMPIDEVLDVFKDIDVGSLPVVEGPSSRHVVGIVEQRDLLRALHLSRVQA